MNKLETMERVRRIHENMIACLDELAACRRELQEVREELKSELDNEAQYMGEIYERDQNLRAVR